MRVAGRHYRTIEVAADGWSVEVIDQTLLPHRFGLLNLRSANDAATAIRDMRVRGAPLIGATAAYGLCLALRADPSAASLDRAHALLKDARPTAINLRWALDRLWAEVASLPDDQRCVRAYAEAARLCDEDVGLCAAIGRHGLKLIEAIAERQQERPINILTHCNAGWLATVDWGTATAPIYLAHAAGIPLHVWVDETRPRNQGAALTAFELGEQGVPHTVIADNTGGHLMQHGLVDLCIVGTDRTTRSGDVANKIGTYLKALAAKDNGVPFYVAVPSPSIDWAIDDGLRQIPIERRDGREVTHVSGIDSTGTVREVRLTPETAMAANFGFDVTPARLISGLITERGVCDASAAGLAGLFPERG